MKQTYRVLAYVIALEVVVQAMFVAYGFFGLAKWVDDGGTLNKAAIEDESISFTGLGGLIGHGMNGTMVIPVIALLFLVVSFFAKVPRGSLWALAVVVLVAVQITLGITAHSVPVLGALHGINAMLLLGTAIAAGRRVSTTTASAPADAALV
jgi:hypothetical protein